MNLLLTSLQIIFIPNPCYEILPLISTRKVITRTRELLEAASEQKRKCEETGAERQQQLNKSEKTVKSISDELIKVGIY